MAGLGEFNRRQRQQTEDARYTTEQEENRRRYEDLLNEKALQRAFMEQQEARRGAEFDATDRKSVV